MELYFFLIAWCFEITHLRYPFQPSPYIHSALLSIALASHLIPAHSAPLVSGDCPNALSFGNVPSLAAPLGTLFHCICPTDCIANRFAYRVPQPQPWVTAQRLRYTIVARLSWLSSFLATLFSSFFAPSLRSGAKVTTLGWDLFAFGFQKPLKNRSKFLLW